VRREELDVCAGVPSQRRDVQRDAAERASVRRVTRQEEDPGTFRHSLIVRLPPRI
jgi:hypothetical protein